jgi:LytS/YehU family sensor histidine kinase
MRVLQEQNQKNEMEKNLNQMYIANLKSLMNSQYLFNVLNTINNFVLTEEPERASEVVSSLSKIIRYNMKHIDRLSTIGKEVEAIRGYLNIKNAGSDKESLIDIRVDEACYDAIIPPFTIQSMLDESFLQDRESKGRARKLYLDISMTDDKVRIFISDTHSDISMASADSRNQKTAPAAEQSSETLNNAIKVLKYCFRDEFSWDVRRNDQGCLITLIIPYWEEEGGALN